MTGQGVTGEAAHVARQAANSRWLERTARVGFLVSGLLHILIGYIALQVAWASAPTKADQSGALSLLAQHGWGRAVLWIGVFGFAALGLWQLTEALVSRPMGDAKQEAGARGKAIAKAAVYLALAVTTFSFARGTGKSSGQQSRDFTSSLMSHPGGRILVVIVGLVVLGVGAYHVYKGAKKKFLQDLVGHPGVVVEYLGVIGYVAKGIALGVVGALFVVAGLHKQPGRATGLDGALRTLRDQPFGSILLTIVALGLAAYGVYSFARAKRARL